MVIDSASSFFDSVTSFGQGDFDCVLLYLIEIVFDVAEDFESSMVDSVPFYPKLFAKAL